MRYFLNGLILLFAAIFLLVGVSVGGLLWQSWREYQGFRQREEQMSATVAQAKGELLHRQQYLETMLEDPVFLDRVVRERLGYARDNEIIFRFEPEPSAKP